MSSGEIIDAPISKIDKAEHLFELLLKKTPDDPDLYRYLGDINMTKGKKHKAEKYFRDYIRLKPDDYYGYYQVGEILNDEQSRKESIKFLETALEHTKADSPDLPERLARAKILSRLGKKKESEEEFEVLLAKYPDDKDIATSYIDTLLDNGNLKKAKAKIDNYQIKYPGNVKLKRSEARYAWTTHDYKRAKKILKKLMKEYPKDHEIKKDYAFVLYNSGNWYKADSLLEELQGIQPADRYIMEARDDIYFKYNRQIRGGFGLTRSGSELDLGPYLIYRQHLKSKWAFQATYTVDRYATEVVNYDPHYVAVGNILDMQLEYSPTWPLTLGMGVAHQFVDSDYYIMPHVFADYNHPIYGRVFFEGFFSEILDSPSAGLYFDGTKDGLGISYEKRFLERVVINPYYESNWYNIESDKTGLRLGDSYGREDIAGAALIVDILLSRPRIFLGYDFHYSKLHLDNDYTDIVGLIEESARHDILYGIEYEWEKGISTEFGGFVGHDPKRDLGIEDMSLYGFNLTQRYRVSRRLDLIGHYEYSSESLSNRTGRYHFFNLEFVYRF